MELRQGSQTLYGPNATARMSDGDTLSISYTDADGHTFLVTLSARAVALIVRESRSGDEYIIQRPPYGNAYMQG